MVSALCLIAAVGYWIAGRRPVRLLSASRRWSVRFSRTGALISALLLVAVICGPLDPVARQTFWLRTTQLVLLLMVAGPLLVLGAPGPRFMRLLRLSEHPKPATLLRPIATLALFSAAMVAVYLPPVYHLTAGPSIARQSGQVVITLLGYGFWAQVISQPGSACSLPQLGRVAYLLASSTQLRVIGLILGFAPASFYGVPLIDQQLAAGILMVPGVLTDLVVLTVCLYLWLAQDDRRHHGGSDSGGHRLPATERALASLPHQVRTA